MSDKEIAEYDIEINLGDIIQIESTNTDYNSYFIVEYIDNEIIDIVNLINNNKQSLNIKDGYLTETTIQKIILLNRSDKEGYARQNNLLLNTYIKIFFTDGTDITGQITNLEENQDMIEITTPKDEKLYIDFEYKGIPKNIPIQKITITEPPGIFDKLEKEGEKEEKEEEEEKEEKEEEEYKPPQISTTFVQKKINFFADLGPEIPNQYDIEMQLSNLLDELISTTHNKIDKTNIYIIVNRFKELREKFSTFDKNNIITGKKNITGQYKPLVHSLDRLDTNLRWIIPTVQNKPKLYSEKINDNQTAFLKSNLDDDLNTYKNAKNDYINNKDYLSFYKGVQDIFKPFDTTISDLKTVNTNFETIVDNLNEDPYNRYVLKINKENDEIIKKKFYLQRYITESIGKNDAISIKSIIMLPKPAIEFSRVSLPGTDILTRTNLSHHWFYYFKFFTKNRNFENIDLNTPYDYEENENNFLETPLSFSIPENTTYKSALDAIIPMTAPIIRMLGKDYIGYNLNDMVSFYEPFMFYSDTIVFAGLSKSHKRGPYKEFIYHIKNNIRKHYEMFKKQNNKYKNYKKKYDKSKEEQEEQEEQEKNKSIFKRIDEDDKKAIIKEYNLKNKNASSSSSSSSESLNKILELDSGKFYMIVQLKLNQKLYTPELEKILKQSEFGEDVFSKSKSCFKHTIAKKYTSLKTLKDDSGKEDVFFDKEYDTTPYEILKKYKEQRKTMNDKQFLDFLTVTLKTEYNNFSEEIAETILLGKKKVEPNNYAVLIIYPKLISTDILSEEEKNSVEIEADVKKQVFYYKREGKQWIKDDDMDNAEFANEIFCNIDKDCFYNRNNEICETIENSASRMKRIAKKSLESKINLTMEEFVKNLKDMHSIKEKQIHKIFLIKKAKNEYFSLRAHSIGTNVKVVEKIVSPYETIKENILQINDFVEKQRLIIEFKSEYCRQAIKDEDKYWFYCKQTDTKLLPTFYYELANAFFKGKYEEHIKKIISKQGKIEDGKIYDKYSNEFICDQDTVTQDEYDENGFKKKTRGELDNDDDDDNDDNEQNETGDYDDVNEGEEEEEGGEEGEEGEEEEKKEEEGEKEGIDNKKFTKTNQIIYSVSSAILSNLDIMSSGKEILLTILAHASRIIEKIMLSETEHLKYEKKKEKTGKKMESYDNYQNKLIFFYTVAVIFVVIQTQIPSLQRRKTSSGCVYNLSGYPLTQNENYSGIKYLSCIIEKMKSGLSEPWKTVKKYKKDELQTKITAVINDIILEPEIKMMLEIKRSHPEPIYIPNEYELAKWVLFQPPLIKTSVEKKISDVSTPLKDEFIETLKTGNKKQHLYMGNIYKKIIENTYAIVDDVNKIVSDENALLKAGPVIFLENACCQQTHIEKGILYFSEKNPNIQKNIDFVDKYEKIYNDIKSLSIPSYICSTRPKLAIVLSNLEKYSSKNIYAAFIHYCNLKTDLPIPSDLKHMCPEKINSLHPFVFEDYVQFLKDNGKSQTNDSLETLMSIVALRNHVQIENEPNADEVKKTDQIIDLIKEPTEENKKILKRKLYLINNSMQKEIIQYLYLHGELGVPESKTVKDSNGKYRYEIFDFLDTIASDWTDIKKLHNFIKNAILNVVDVIPSLLTNKKKINYDSKSVIGKHWKFAKTHIENIKNSINKYFENINSYNDDNVCNLLQNITSLDDDSTDDIKLYDLKTLINNMTIITESFDTDECKQIYKYFYLTLFHTIMVESQDFTMFGSDESDLLDKENEFYKKVSELIVIIIKMDMDNKKVENFTYSHLFEQNYKKKTKEKNILTAELGKIDKSDFDIEKQLKKHKLERWNTNKDVFKYNKENYEYNE